MLNLIFNHYKKNFSDIRINNVLDKLGQGCYFLPKRKDCLELIENLKWFLSEYTDEDIESINCDSQTLVNGNRPSYLQDKRQYIPSLPILKEKTKYPGYVYFLQDDTGRIKIGKTKELNKRIFHIGIHLPTVPILFHFFKTSDMTTSEKSLHEKYKDYRLGGEWFNIPKEELTLIKRMQ